MTLLDQVYNLLTENPEKLFKTSELYEHFSQHPQISVYRSLHRLVEQGKIHKGLVKGHAHYKKNPLNPDDLKSLDQQIYEFLQKNSNAIFHLEEIHDHFPHYKYQSIQFATRKLTDGGKISRFSDRPVTVGFSSEAAEESRLSDFIQNKLRKNCQFTLRELDDILPDVDKGVLNIFVKNGDLEEDRNYHKGKISYRYSFVLPSKSDSVHEEALKKLFLHYRPSKNDLDSASIEKLLTAYTLNRWLLNTFDIKQRLDLYILMSTMKKSITNLVQKGLLKKITLDYVHYYYPSDKLLEEKYRLLESKELYDDFVQKKDKLEELIKKSKSKKRIVNRRKRPISAYDGITGDFVTSFESVRDAARAINKNHGSLSKSIKRHGTCGGYYWEYDRIGSQIEDNMTEQQINEFVEKRVMQDQLV